MIYRLEIENFYSILEPQVIDLSVPKSVHDDPERFAQVIDGADLRAPKVVTIFGANASGKSNVLKALTFIVWFANASFHYHQSRLPFVPFSQRNWQRHPTRLAIEFSGLSELSIAARTAAAEGSKLPESTYRYELEIETVDSHSTVLKELLRHRPNGRGRWQRVFERTGDKIIGSSVFPIKNHEVVKDIIRPNASLISTLVQLKHEPSAILHEMCQLVNSNILIDRADPSTENCIEYLASNPDALMALNRELQRIDVGLREMSIIQGTHGPIAHFEHVGLDTDIMWDYESEGTRSFIRRFPMLFAALDSGGIAIIDELDASLHPALLPEITRWFYDPEKNKYNAQLWTTCHSAPLLEELRKQEIVLCEATRQGRTSVYSLMDVQRVRGSDNLYKKYLGGVYGAVPHVG